MTEVGRAATVHVCCHMRQKISGTLCAMTSVLRADSGEKRQSSFIQINLQETEAHSSHQEPAAWQSAPGFQFLPFQPRVVCCVLVIHELAPQLGIGAVTETCLVPCVPEDAGGFDITTGRGLIRKCCCLFIICSLEPEYFKCFSAFYLFSWLTHPK